MRLRRNLNEFAISTSSLRLVEIHKFEIAISTSSTKFEIAISTSSTKFEVTFEVKLANLQVSLSLKLLLKFKLTQTYPNLPISKVNVREVYIW